MDWPSGRKVLLDCGWQRNSKIPLLTTGPFLSSRSSRIYYLNFDTKLTDGAQANTADSWQSWKLETPWKNLEGACR